MTLTSIRRLGVLALGVVVLTAQFLAIVLMWLSNDLAGVGGEGASTPWIDVLRTVLLAALLPQAIALGALCRLASSRAWATWIGLWLSCLAGAWIAFTGPLDAWDAPILVTGLTVPAVMGQGFLLRTAMPPADNDG